MKHLTLLIALLATPLVVSTVQAAPPPKGASAKPPAEARAKAHQEIAKAAGMRTRKVIKHVAMACKEAGIKPEGHLRKAAVNSRAAKKAWDKDKYRASVHLTLVARAHARKAGKICKASPIGEAEPTPEETEAVEGLPDDAGKEFVDEVEASVPDEDTLLSDPEGALD